jgi:3-dehydroquinate dehydratase-2
MKILVLNGPNLNLLGRREPEIYGRRDYAALERFIRDAAAEIGAEVELVQSNHEGVLVDRIQEALGRFDGIVLNPAAYTHTSVALLDALKAVSLPAVEVHLSDPDAREDFRRVSYVRAACLKTVSGLGFESYRQALLFLADHLREEKMP